MNAPLTPPLAQDFYKAARSRKPEDMARYLMIERTDLAPADLIIGFGNVHASGHIAHKCKDLYQRGLARYILLTGGKPHGDGRSEAAFMADILRDNGVPKGALILETRSLNTQENVENSRALISSLMPSFHPSRAIAVGHIVAGRRFLMTLRKNWPELTTLMASHIWPEGVTPDNWQGNPRFVKHLEAQFDRIGPYFAKGFIAEIEPGRAKTLPPQKKRITP